jgi:NADP-dependent 3-hydroxy acid dehydrogenase YdfG
MLNVENKVIVIAGASSGIGEAAVKLLAENSAKVVLGARRTEKLEKLVKEIHASGGTAEFKAVDVSDGVLYHGGMVLYREEKK